MGFVKGLAISLLSFLLFLSLSIFGPVLMLNQTLLNPDFVVSEVDKLDVSALAQELISEQVPQQEEFIAEVVGDTVADLEPWLKEQVSDITYSSYDYLLGRSQSLSLVIPLEPVKESLKDNLRQALLQSPPPELAGASPAEIEQYINQYYRQFAEDIPSTFQFDESSLPPEVQATLPQLRQAISYFQIAYPALIGFMLLLVLGIFLINRDIRKTSRGLGITFLTYGVLEYVTIFVSTRYLAPQVTQFGLSPSLQAWLPELLRDLFAPLEIFSISLAAAGVALIIVSIIYRRETSA